MKIGDFVKINLLGGEVNGYEDHGKIGQIERIIKGNKYPIEVRLLSGDEVYHYTEDELEVVG